MRRVLVFGQSGQVARALAGVSQRNAALTFLDRAQADLSDPPACAAAIAAQAPDAVINAAAWTDVDGAESHETQATRINGHAPGAMAEACVRLGIPLIHISTDYVFDGSGQAPWREEDPPNPQSAYGRGKLAGEVAIRASGARHAILRTSWVFAPQGANFVRTMVRLGRTRPMLRVVADQIGGPTPAGAIATACLHLAQALCAGHAGGTYHLAGQPFVSRADFARAILAQASLPARVQDIATVDYPSPARRPLNCRLDGTKLMRDFGIAPPDWRAALTTGLKESTQPT